MAFDNSPGTWSSVHKQCSKLWHSLEELINHTGPASYPPPRVTDHNSPPPNHWMGFFVCSECKAYFYPSYRPGPHPVGYLRCNNPACRCVIEPSATTSTALKRVVLFDRQQIFISVPRLTGPHREQNPYFTVCPCGLTHRARLYKPSLKKKWKQFPKSWKDEPTMDRLRRFMKQKIDRSVTLIEFEHVQCLCGRRYDVFRWQHFVLSYDRVFHIDGADAHGRWTEIRHSE